MSVIKGNHGGLGGSGAPGGALGSFYTHDIERSLRFDDASNPYLYRTPSSQGNLTTFTFSCWVKRCNLGSYHELFHEYPGSGERSQILFMNNDTLKVELEAANTNHFLTNRLFRDVSSWYNIVVAYNSGDGTQSNRVKIYVNGIDESDTANGGGGFSTANYPNQSATSGFNTTGQHEISTYDGSDYHIDGYLTEVNFIDGTALTAASFGETKDGVWVPKSSSGLTFGTNGFYLPFDDSSAIGDDESSNTNDFTANNLAATDVVKDSPTNNFATMSPLLTDTNNTTFSEGNLKTVNSAASTSGSSIAVNSGKWFVEMVCTAKTATNAMIGICTVDGFDGQKQLDESDNGGSGHGYVMNATKLPGGASYGATWAIDDIIGVALDLDSTQNTVTFYKNGSSQGAIDIDNALYVFCNSNGQGSSTVTYVSNFGQDGTFAGEITAGGNADGNGVGDFKYSVPSGYLALCTENLPDITIGPGQSTLATDNFNTVLYTGNATNATAISGVGFSPDWTWIKVRNNTNNHRLFDTVRGAGKDLISNSTSTESTTTTRLQSFDSDGFTVGTNAEVNSNGHNIVAWNWLAGTAFSNDASATGVGTIDCAGQVNTTAGFSIVSFTGGSTQGSTLKHGLDTAPSMVIAKARTAAQNWWVFHSSLGYTKNTALNLTDASATDNNTWLASPTSSLITIGDNFTTSNNYIAYCFANTDGYLKAGSYTGNGNADGAFIFTGFRPSWILVRSIGVSHWLIFDVARHPSNVNDSRLFANLTNAEDSAYSLDLLSNGFKLRHSGSDFNTSGGTHIEHR